LTRSHRSSLERRLLPALLLAGAALVSAAPAAARPGSAEVQAKARAVFADPRFQRELPRHTEPSDLDAAPADRRVPGGEGSSASQLALPVLGAGAFLARIVFLVLLVVAVLLIVGWVLRVLIDRGWKTAEAGGSKEDTASAASSEREPAFEDAARLAAEGRYAEAIHALLLAAIRHFAERSRAQVQPSRTSRELVRLLPLAAEAREAFTELVRAVELSLFGGVPVGREEYERSLSRFRALTRRPA
jgi:Domain of unknown function (DUF4129)